MKKGILLFAAGGFALVLSLIIGTIQVNKLFLPTTGEILGALLLPLVFVAVACALFILGFILPRNARKAAAEKAELVADGYGTALYSFDDALDALKARILAWEKVSWVEDARWQETLRILKTINQLVADLSKMSKWFSVSLDGDLYASALDAVHKVDTDKLRSLSGFVGYCATVTEFEMRGVHFKKACDNALVEIQNALELYASMRGKLSSFSGNAADRERLKAEIEQISGIY